MAVSCKWYGQALLKALNGKLNIAGTSPDSLKVMLTTSAYVPDQDAHTVKTDVTNEVVGTAYVAGGATLTGVTLTYDAASNVIKLDASDVEWASSQITARRAVVYDSTTGMLLGFVDFGTDVVSNSGPFDIVWDAGGILTVNVN